MILAVSRQQQLNGNKIQFVTYDLGICDLIFRIALLKFPASWLVYSQGYLPQF